MIDSVFIISFLRSAIRLAVPLGFASMGEGFQERSGSDNIGLEGTMLIGAWAGVIGAYFTGNPWWGLILAITLGMLITGFQSFITTFLHSNEIVTGVAINTLGLGLTSFGYRAFFGISGPAILIPTFKSLEIPLLSKIPIIGPVLFNQPLVVYLMIIVGFFLWFILRKTNWGLHVRAAGEDPWVAEAEGGNVYRIRFICYLLTGVLASSGGAFISLYNVGQFFDGMTAGRGFIALAIVVIGRWNPLGILAASVLFGASEALGLALQARLGGGSAFYLLMIIPFLITMIILPFVSGGKAAPSALGMGYERGKGT